MLRRRLLQLSGMGLDPDRSVPAPELHEVALIWWDVDVAPVVAWDAAGTRFVLADPRAVDAPDRRLELLVLAEPADDPHAVAQVLAEGLAACDFPPTGDGAAPGRVRATLRAAGVGVVPVETDGPS